ncbi:MAG TPA: quinone oxidoreductase [Stellaceae bacterium]|nr:quinone oxidoreductase [Stellaceae bacterium]
MLTAQTHELRNPDPDEALIRQTAVGLNYIDIQHRTGRYPLPTYPSPIGLEAAGVVEAVGTRVETVRRGDRVVYSAPPIGAYADWRLMPSDRLVRLPPDILDEIAAAVLTKGLTAHYLLFTTYSVRAGETILVHAAAGGVGQLLCQWAHHLGARVIGTAGSDAKAEIARQHGCDATIVYTREDFVARVRALTGGAGVPVVYDAVGRDTFEGSLNCLKPRGVLVSFGTPSGPIPPFDLFRLNTMGSLYVTSPAFVTHTQERSDLLERSRALFDGIARGVLRVAISGRYPLADAARAHADLQGRRTAGAQILVP